MSPPNGAPSAPCGTAASCASPVLRWSGAAGWAPATETLAVEAPLTIEIGYERAGQPVAKVLAVTMRTPGHDEELALGFLRAEGLVPSRADVLGGSAADTNARGEALATWRVQLVRAPREDLQRISRSLVTSSACGLCSRPTLAGLPVAPPYPTIGDTGPVEPATIAALPDRLRRAQPTFFATGGSHGAALGNAAGELLLAREDVGRHNAVDKLTGAALLRDLDCAGLILVLSGRASFELLQKAAAVGIAVVVAVGAPSSAAVDLAHAAGITLAGFTREGRFNVYAHAGRLALAATPEPAAVSS